MPHPRQQIRDLVVAAITGLAITGIRVFPSRVYPLQEQELPGLCVYTLEENAERISFRKAMHQLEVKIEAYVKANSNYDDVMDEICLAVQQAIANDSALNNVVADIFQASYSEELSKDADKPIVVGQMTYLVEYCTNPKTPDTIV